MKNNIPRTTRKRILIVMSFFVLLMVGLVMRLAYIQLGEGSMLQNKALDQHTRDRAVAPTRGTIYDRNMKAIAQSASVATIGVVHAQIQDPELVSKVLSEKLGLKYDDVYKKVTKKVAFERIATKVEKSVADEIREMNLEGVKVDADSKRYYPYSNLASHIIGFVGKDNQGIVGLEVQYDSYLKGTEGKILMETNAKGERRTEATEIRVEPVDGNHLITTFDMTMQQYAQQAIEKIVEEKQAERGTIVLMNPQNGEIYAMANTPDFDLNEPFTINDPEIAAIWHTLTIAEKQTNLNKMWRNFTINDTYEPGSTFKVFTSAMGLEEGVVTPESKFNCTGSHVVAGRTIKCWRSPNSHGEQTFVEGVQNSCNPVFMLVGEDVGATKFYEYMMRFGFNSKTGIDLPGEAVGILHKKENIGPVELATMSFGQSFQITPLQLLSGVSSVINGGYKITPHFGKEIIDSNNNVVETFEYKKGEQILSTETSEQLKTILESVVSEGTGNKSYIPGYRIGGKTATSQKLPRGSGKYIASFMSFAPAEDPEVIALVLIDEPKGVYYGGAVAGPVMKELLQNILPYIGIERVFTEEEKMMEEVQTIEVPNFIGMSIADAKKQAATIGMKIIIEGEGNIVRQLPDVGDFVNKESKIILYAE
ncbi:MAG: penicillin-binding transpeptidase domain-containing protein [Cellulosilyticaceae bacterium]